jgi:bifunctional UDP-N-acetylglucosamine pyrophosphorylase/glucosamine-1-phosphate N-acetyltransferase
MTDYTSIPSRKICAVVPAAGRGTRLGGDVPKVFVPLLPGVTIWDAVHDPLSHVADHIVLVLSPEGRNFLQVHPPKAFAKTEVAVQEEPLGMGDAIFGAAEHWCEFDDVLIVWGDQFNLSRETLQGCLALHAGEKKPALTIPVVATVEPYVEYIFAPDGRLTEVRQTREGATCAPGGLSDIGMFLLSGGDALINAWANYRREGAAGTVTGEINFLPFLVHLSSRPNWKTGRYEASDPAEAIGINTPEDLAFARELLRKKAASAEEVP